MSESADDVSDDIKRFIHELILKYNLKSTPQITYHPGSETGDGYLSRSLAVTIDDKATPPLDIFIKTALHITSNEGFMPFKELYSNEICFYERIYPTYLRFLEEKNIKNGFRQVPKCYKTSPKKIIALENLKKKGYKLFDNKKMMSDDHIELVLKTIAKFHAISFAFKDQRKKDYEQLMAGVTDIIEVQFESNSKHIELTRTSWVNTFLASLDPVEDKYTLERLGDLGNKLNVFFKESTTLKSEYSILIHGDFWSNNIMFLYEALNDKKPLDVMLIDWQMIRYTIPTYDLAFFFYTVASKEALNKLTDFLKVYHIELSENIKMLGSDPNILYPYSVLQDQWKEHGKYGFSMALLTIFLMLVEKEEISFNFEELDLEHPESWDSTLRSRNNDEYFRRLKILAEHLIANDFL